MSEISMERTVGDLVIERPSRSRVLAKLGIDFCCGGGKSLEQACRERQLDAGDVLAMLRKHETPNEVPSELANEKLGSICDHIETSHHAYLKEELPRLDAMLQKVARVHGERFPYMVEVLETFAPFAEDMFLHMQKEERVLFPAIRRIEASGGGNVTAPIRMMMFEHDRHGETLRKLNELTGGYQPPDGACNTFRAVLDGLAELERDLHEHIHKENNILFPRAAALG